MKPEEIYRGIYEDKKMNTQSFVDRYFSKGDSSFFSELPQEQQEEIRQEISKRYERIKILMSQPKIIEYAERILSGEHIDIESLPQNMAYAIQYLVKEKQETKKREEIEAIKDVEHLSIDQLFAQIPTRYQKLPVELIKEFWVEPIRVDDASCGRDFVTRKNYILGLIEENEKQESEKKLLSDLMDKLQGKSLTTNLSEEQQENKQEVELTKKIELNPDIVRVSRQEIFGDSNGSYVGFVEHLQSRGLIHIEDNGEIVWKGGNARVTFLGDILGDRIPEGEKIYTELVKLKKVAQESGGNVSWLAGNHDNMFNAVLFGFTSEFGTDVERDMSRLTNYVGNLEMVRYLPDQIIEDFFAQEGISKFITEILTNTSDFNKKIDKRKKIHATLSQNPNADKDKVNAYHASTIDQEKNLIRFQETYNDTSKSWQEKMDALLYLGEEVPQYALVKLGQDILDNRENILTHIRIQNPALLDGICQQELVIITDDVLHCHTNFTRNMILMIESNMSPGDDFKKGVEKVNKFYQDILRWYASSEPRNPAQLEQSQITYFNQIRDEFISTSRTSRINYSEDTTLSEQEKKDITNRLKGYGINAVLHGHNYENGEIMGSASLPILSLDRNVYKGSESVENRPIATASISTKGTISYY